jgi:hypothetical protein
LVLAKLLLSSFICNLFNVHFRSKFTDFNAINLIIDNLKQHLSRLSCWFAILVTNGAIYRDGVKRSIWHASWVHNFFNLFHMSLPNYFFLLSLGLLATLKQPFFNSIYSDVINSLEDWNSKYSIFYAIVSIPECKQHGSWLEVFHL